MCILQGIHLYTTPFEELTQRIFKQPFFCVPIGFIVDVDGKQLQV